MQTTALDPVTVEVVRNKLDGIANEMELTLLKSSCSPIVKEGLDASASLFTLQGETLAQAVAIPIHLATLIPCVARILAEFPLDTMREGDLYCMNDPYLGGTHLPDIAVIMPVFARGRPLAFSATMTHHQDVGGMTPGSVPTDATEVFQEGIRLPPLKLREGEKFNDTLLQILRRNVRIPETFEGDLMAQVAACSVGARRLSALAENYGDNHLTAIFADLLDRSEAMTRDVLRSLPNGTYRAVDFLDNDGVDLDRRIRIEVAVTIDGNGMSIDFTGSSAQVRGPFNAVPSGSLAAACYVVRAITDPTIPTNGGCFRPIALRLPEGSIVNPREPAPVNARTATIKRIAGTILAALAQAAPGRVPADSGGELLVLAFGGERPDGTRYVTGELVAGGSGASAGKDGVDVIETDATNCMNLPAEALELDAPIRVHRVALRPDSGGAGAQRGGLGTLREYEILHGDVRFTHRGERHFIAPKGRGGGGDGAMARTVIHRAGGGEETVPSKLVTTLHAGDRVVFETAGGGGYGDPAARDPAQVRADLADGKISPEGAKAYGKI
ncbi:MAG TPA: hydantoinase B/oxoprolinase family protein [Xanthobacteraceae bacterium]|jgi:N-methylhydantoinase B|nr:hydantoinase B/oxoprolinase family protein [Xanthobacteraceae bacterium]